MKAAACRECTADRVARWERMRAANGLTEEQWPRPGRVEFRSSVELRLHKVRKHR